MDDQTYPSGDTSLVEASQQAAIERILEVCVQRGLVDYRGTVPDWTPFIDTRARIRSEFYVPESSITVIMARLLYGVAAAWRPQRILGIGTYFGNAFAWLAAPGFTRESHVYVGKSALALDTDKKAVAGAENNFTSIFDMTRVQSLCLDGHQAGLRASNVDLLYLDAEDPITRKGVYTSLLQSALPFLANDCIVLAHDIDVPKFRQDMMEYREHLGGLDAHQGSVPLRVDDCGLLLSRLTKRP